MANKSRFNEAQFRNCCHQLYSAMLDFRDTGFTRSELKNHVLGKGIYPGTISSIIKFLIEKGVVEESFSTFEASYRPGSEPAKILNLRQSIIRGKDGVLKKTQRLSQVFTLTGKPYIPVNQTTTHYIRDYNPNQFEEADWNNGVLKLRGSKNGKFSSISVKFAAKSEPKSVVDLVVWGMENDLEYVSKEPSELTLWDLRPDFYATQGNKLPDAYKRLC